MADLVDLYRHHGQSPWLDNLRRDWLRNGELARWVDNGIRGVTSNPAIFQKAMTSSDLYDAQLAEQVAAGRSIVDAYWALVTSDIEDALAVLRPVFDASGGQDGFVSVEVDPHLADDAEATVKAARALAATIDEPNLYIKIPGTEAGLSAISQMIAEGVSVNVTLIFSIDRYEQVMEAYLSGLEARLEAAGPTADLSTVSSVASFFVSRVDAAVDAALDAIGTEGARSLRGKAAIANARVAYGRFGAVFSGERWERLAAHGARVQRPLWASTSTKNPAYPPTLYVDTLIGPDTVNTLPDATIASFLEVGTLGRTIDDGLDDAVATLSALEEHGIDLAAITSRLERDGVTAFETAFDDLLDTLGKRAADLG